MVSEDALIRQGIRYSDNLFKVIEERVLKALEQSDSLEEFLQRTKDFTLENPMVTTGYQDTMTNLITSITNNVKFERAAQRELVRAAISSRVAELIKDVGDDLKDTIRETVKQGYDEGLHSRDIAKRMSRNIQSINGRRARTIARTEVARAYVVSDYIVNKERGATGYTVVCRPDCCPICAKDYAGKENHVVDENGDGHLIGGNVAFLIDNTDMLPPRHPNCYDKETKVYTKNGWKYFKDLTDKDLVLSMNPKGNELEFLKPVRHIKYRNTGKQLYHIHNKWFDVCVTEDHDCFIHQRRDGGNRGKYYEPQFRKPSELTSESKFIRCIDIDRENPKTMNVNGLEFEPRDFAFFMAWYISEGSVLHNPETAKQHRYPVKITQEIGENRDLLERELRRIFGYLGFRVAVGKSYFEVYSKELYYYLAPLGYSHEKYIPPEVFDLDKECLNIFLDNYVLGDGHERTNNNELVQNSTERSLFTSSPRLRDDLSYLILLCGFYPSIAVHTPKGKVTVHKNGEYVQKNDVFRIGVNKTKYSNYRGCTVDLIDYDDYVYCVELPKWHTLWVMRNGKTSWNGNCRCGVNYFRADGDEIRSKISTKKPTGSTGATEPTSAQLKDNLTPSERAKYINFKRTIGLHEKWLSDNPSAPAKDIANRKAKLAELMAKFEELKRKAMGGESTGKPTSAPKPKTTPKPKKESKPKPKEEESKTKQRSMKFEDVNTIEDVAEYFGFEYSFEEAPQVDKENQVMVGNDGRRYGVGSNPNKGKFHKFYDRENDCTLYFHQSLGKNLKDGLLIDLDNSGKGRYNLKDVVKMYDDAPKVLKEANTSISFTNRKAKRLRGFNSFMPKTWMEKFKGNSLFEKQISHGREHPAWIDIYKDTIFEGKGDGWSLQRTLYHEMAHGLDNMLSDDWSNRGRFSDKRTADGYGALIRQQTNYSDDFKTKTITPKEIVDGLSSEYGKRDYDKTYSYSEDFADCVSMVVFKYIEDKTGASILPPDWTWKNRKSPYTYEEFVKKYPHKVKFIEELLGIAN